jgi:hypothetical protein
VLSLNPQASRRIPLALEYHCRILATPTMKFSAAVALSGAVVAVSGAALDARQLNNLIRGLLPNGTNAIVPVTPLLHFPKVQPKTKEQIKEILEGSVRRPELIHPELEPNNTVRRPPPKGAPRRPEGAGGPGPKGPDFRLKAATSPARTSSAAASSTAGADEGTATLQAWPCESPSVRVEWRNLNDGQRDRFVGAIRCLMERPSANSGLYQGSRSRYEDLTGLHNQVQNEVHDFAVFLVWHRYFLGIFESLLRDECGYQDPLPWWDESRDSGNFARAPMFTERWFGRAPTSNNNEEFCIEQTGWGNFRPNVGGEDCLRRRVDEGASSNTNQANVNDCIYNAQNYDNYRSCMEGW